jgi:hypothetical protein
LGKAKILTSELWILGMYSNISIVPSKSFNYCLGFHKYLEKKGALLKEMSNQSLIFPMPTMQQWFMSLLLESQSK